MSIRSYKNVFERFSTLFPELARAVDVWKGVRFADRHIVLMMKNGAVIHFKYAGTDDWSLICAPLRMPEARGA